MDISVALATYNGGAFLAEQLKSLSNQTRLPKELVVSDDGSTDGTLDIVRDFAKSAPFSVRVLEKTERLGFADNFLHAAENCDGDVIAFCDQDDLWLPGKLERGLERLVADEALLSMHRLTVTDVDLTPRSVFDQGIGGDGLFGALELDPYITGWGNTMLFRRELVHLLPRADRPRQPQSTHRPLSHDTWVYVLAAALGKVSHISDPLILYRQHGSNAEGVAVRENRLWYKLLAWTDIRREHIPSRIQFYDDMISRFQGLAVSGCTDAVREAAEKAAAKFVERRDYQLARRRLFAGASVAERWKAYRDLQDIPREKTIWLGSKIKEFVLGVGGLGSVQ